MNAHELNLIDGDLCSAFECVPLSPSSPVREILATIRGDNDGPDWHWILSLEAGGFAYVRAGCDCTGWECQSGGEIHEAPTIRDVMRLVGDDFRAELRDQLSPAMRSRL